MLPTRISRTTTTSLPSLRWMHQRGSDHASHVFWQWHCYPYCSDPIRRVLNPIFVCFCYFAIPELPIHVFATLASMLDNNGRARELESALYRACQFAFLSKLSVHHPCGNACSLFEIGFGIQRQNRVFGI